MDYSAFTHLSRWWLSGRRKQSNISKTASSDSSSNVRSDSSKAAASSLSSSSAPVRTNKRRQGNHGAEIDKEFDVVLVQSDCAESEGDVDWSIGWLEPHGPELQGEDDSENSFAVLVPCYGRRHINLEGGYQQSSKGDKQVEKWRSYFQKS